MNMQIAVYVYLLLLEARRRRRPRLALSLGNTEAIIEHKRQRLARARDYNFTTAATKVPTSKPSGGPVQSSRLRSVDAPSSRLQKRQVDCAPPVESTQLKRPLDGRRLDSVDLTEIAST